jgi:uncharacterized protein YecT (DUF1311 family)
MVKLQHSIRLLSITLLLTVATSSGALSASPPSSIPNNSAALNACIGRIQNSPLGSRWPGMQQCQEEELRRQDKRLNGTYAALAKAAGVLGKESAASLMKGQRAWIAYRDAWCSFETSHDSAPSPEISGLFCKIQLTIGQADRLVEQLDEIGN